MLNKPILRILRLQSSARDVQSYISLFRAGAAEFIGTFLLVFIGVASCLKTKIGENIYESVAVERIALAFGFAVASIIWSIKHVSGGHINPAVTFGLLLTRRVSLVRAILYVAAQFGGAVSASFLFKKMTYAPGEQKVITIPNPNHETFTEGSAVLVEYIITFMLVFTISAACDKKRSEIGGFGPLMIGLAVAACHMAYASLEGASMNPVRSFGPALAYFTLTSQWVYWVGPLIGGAVGALTYEHMFSSEACIHRFKCWLMHSDFDPDSYEAPLQYDKPAPLPEGIA